VWRWCAESRGGARVGARAGRRSVAAAALKRGRAWAAMVQSGGGAPAGTSTTEGRGAGDGGGGGVGDGGRASLPPELSLLTGTFVFVVWIENGEGRGRHELLYPGTFSPGW
jgi:hypothetical protein